MTLSSKNTRRDLLLLLSLGIICFSSGCSFVTEQKTVTFVDSSIPGQPAATLETIKSEPVTESVSLDDNTVVVLEQPEPTGVADPEIPALTAEAPTEVEQEALAGGDFAASEDSLADDEEPLSDDEATAAAAGIEDPEENPEEILAEELSIPESVETAEEEVKQLEALGPWEAGQPPIAEASVSFDFPVTLNKQVEFYLNFFTNEKPKVFTTWLKRSGRYLPMIHRQLEERGLPKDLAYLAMIESGFNVTAYSPAKAAGMWQFISATGTRYKLAINKEVDERRDPVKATGAALSYLADLYREFGSWYLAVASYNAGEGKIRRAIDMYKTTDFWELAQGSYLATETKRYVPMLIASILIAKEPKKYGFTNIEYEKPLAYETVEVPRGTALKVVSIATDQDFEEICKLNRELKKAVTPSYCKTYAIKVPVGARDTLLANLSRVKAVKSTAYKTHVVKKGENLAKISKKYGLSKSTLLAANGLRTASVSRGTKLRIPYQTTSYQLLPAARIAVAKNSPSAGNDTASQVHTVKSGDTAYKIARQYGVTTQMLAAWNKLGDVSRLAVGQELLIGPATANSPQAAPVYIAAAEAPAKIRLASMAAADKIQPAPAQKADADDNTLLTYYRVRKGDSLWDIAQKYNITPRQIKDWNRISGNQIQPGQRLTIKIEKGG